MLYGYIVVLNPKPFAISNSFTLVETDNSTVLANEKGQQTQLRAFHPVHSLFIYSNVRGTKSTVIGPSHEFLHYFFSHSQAHRLTLPGSPNSNPELITTQWQYQVNLHKTLRSNDYTGI